MIAACQEQPDMFTQPSRLYIMDQSKFAEVVANVLRDRVPGLAYHEYGNSYFFRGYIYPPPPCPRGGEVHNIGFYRAKIFKAVTQ